jgi:hypothetical protein
MNEDYKTFEELKEELGDKFEEYMYKANIELLNKLDKIKEYCKEEKEDLIAGGEVCEDILELLEEIE